MGYYSNLALECLELDYDRSYPTPEKQLLWRLDDLYDRLDFLTEAGASYNSRTRLSDDDIRYAVPNYFEHIADVENAIELAMSELNFKKSSFIVVPILRSHCLYKKRILQFAAYVIEIMNTRRYRNDNCNRF